MEKTRSRQGAAWQALLRQAVRNEGQVVVKVPFSIADEYNWKTATGSCRDDPDRVANTSEGDD